MARQMDHVHKWYCSARWNKMRRAQLQKQHMCECPHCKGKGLIANVVDHVIPHRGNSRLFWDTKNLRSMNMKCAEEGHDLNGAPLSDDHPWNEKHTVH